MNLGRLILEDTDILLLDEPTNHLDLQATEWLEEYIRTFRGTVVTISHDRYFLDRTVTRIIEVLDGKAEFYSGNYSFYAVEKERRYQERLKQYLKEQAKIQQLEKAAEQMHLWAFMGNDASINGPSPWKSASSGCVLRRSPPRPKKWMPALPAASSRATRCCR